MSKWNLLLLGLLLTSAPISSADETPLNSPAAPGTTQAAPGLTLEECRKAVAGYLLETPPASRKDVFDRIWAGYAQRTQADADAIAGGIEGDLGKLSINWTISNFSGEQDRKLLAELIVDGYLNSTGLSEGQVQALKDNFKLVMKPQQPESSTVFLPPQNLSVPVDQLLEILGYKGYCKLNGVAFPWTPKMCAELAVHSYNAGYVYDAIAVADHGLRFGEDARLLYIRGVAELRAGDPTACLETMKKLIVVHPPARKTYELANINDPVVVRFLIAFKHLREESDHMKSTSSSLLYLTP